MTIRIYDKNGGVRAEVSVSDSSSQVKEIGGENVLSLSFVYWSCLELDVQDYVDFAGERYWLTEHYKPEMRSTMEWSYDVKLYGLESLLGRFLVLDRSGESTEAEFVLTGPPVEHVRLIVSCVNAGLGVSPDSPDRWLVGEVTGTENVTLEYKGLRCDAALSALAEAVDTEWWTDGRTLNLCRCEVGPELTLAYGLGLTGLSRERSDDASFYTRLYPLGSRRNIDAEVYGHRRLQLAGGVAYVDMPDLVEKYGVIERYEEAAFAGIYPRRVGRVSSVRSEVRRGRDGQDYTVWFFGDEGLPFDPNDYEIAGLKRVSFQEGSELAGLGTGEDHYFEVNYDSETREFEIITIWPYDDDTQLPGGALVPKVGDRYILWNMRMPPAYYDLAEAELAEAVAAYNDEHRKDCSVYKCSTDEVWMAEHELAVSGSETDSRPLLCVGRKVRLESHEYFAEGYRYSRITRLTRSVNRPYSMDLEISDVLVRSFRQHVEEGMRDVKTYARSLFGGVSIPDLIRVGDTRKATDSNVFSALRVMVDGDRKFVRKDWADEHQTVAGNVSFMKGVGVQQKLTVGGDIEVNGTAGLHGDVFIGDALEVGDGAEIGGDLGVVGNTTLGGTTHSAGNVTVGTVATSLLPGTTSGVVLGSDGKILAKSLELSESLVVPEIRYNRATTIVGTEWRTQGGGIIESVTPDTATTGHGTLRLEDGEAGAIMEDDLCIGIWHNIDGDNATADYDSRTGNFTFAGFQTIYFQIERVSGANSQNFTYKLRQGYTFHPQAGMHFAAYTNIGATTKVGRQSFTYETKDYQVSLRNVTDWTWSENNIYYVRGKLAGFTVGTTTFPADSTETGLILGNIYFSGTIRNIEANIRSVSVTQTKGGWVDTSETDEVTIRLVDGNGENKSDEVDTCTCTSGGSSVPVTTLYDGSTKIGFRVLAQNITAVKTYDVTLTCSDGRVFTAAFAEHPSPTRGENAVMYQLIATPDILGLDKDENITPGTTIQFRVLKLDGNTKTYLSVTQCRTEGLKMQYGATTWAITTASDLQFTWQKTINQITFKLLDSSNAELAEKTVKMIKDGETGADATFTTWQLYPSADSVSVDKNGSPSRQGFIVSVRKVTESGMTSYGVNNLPQDVSIRYVVNAISPSKDSQLIYAENNGSGVEKYNSYYDGTTVVNVPTTSTVANKIVGNNDTYGLVVSVPNTLAVPSGNTFITFSLWLGNTLYDTKTVPFFKDGQDGQNAIRLDSDNDMDAIPTDSTGEVVNGFSISTHLVLFDGSTPVSSGITAPTPASLVIGTGEDDLCTPTVSMTSGLIAITWTFAAGDTFHSERYEVPISVQYGGKTYTSTFTAVVVKSGEQGVAPTLYQLQPNPSRVSFSKGSNNTLTPATITLKCGYTKNVSGTITSSEGVSVDGYKIYYRYKSATGWGAFQNFTTGGLSIGRTTTYTDVEFVLSSSSAAASVATTNIIDRETVPITKDGLDGTSVTVSSNSTQYAASTSGTDVPSTGWQDSVPDVAKGAFLWTRVTTTYSDGTTATSYGVSYRGTDGTSPSILSTKIRYAASTSGTTAPTSGWQETIPFVAQRNYLWTRTEVTYSTASGTITTTSYSVARAGADGDTGQPGADGYTTHFAYSTSADGSQNFSTTNFDGATYIGTYRDQNAADSTDYTKYTWTRWRGVDGENVIHVDLDNENDAMLYDGSGNLISGSVTSNASLYDGTTKVSSGVTWSLPTKTNCTATITTAGVVTVTAMRATTGKVVVRATYKSKTYDAILSLKKLVGIDKYELVCTPNSVTYNTTTGNMSASAITIRVYKTAQNGTRTNISTLPSNYTLQGTEAFSRAYSGGYATMPVNSSLSSMSVTLKDASGVVLDNETIPINKSTNGANGNDGKDAQPVRPNIIANGREERYITGTTNSNYPINPSYSETSSGVTYSVFYGWRHLEIDYTQGERVIVSMNLRWNGLTAVSGATMRVRILMFTGSGNPTIFYKAITTASGEGRFESASTPTSASGRYLCRVELAGCSAGTIWYSDVKAEIADDNTSTATPWLPCAHDYAGVNPNILDYTKDGKNTEGNLMWVQSIANQGVMTIKEDDFALNNPVSYVDAASLSSTQTAIRDEGIVTIPANQPCIVSWDACYVETEPYRWWLQLLDVNSSSHINIHYYCLGTSDSSYIIGAGKHLRQQTTNDEGWQRFFVYLDPVSSQRQFKIQFKHDGRNGDGTTSALHIRRVKAELGHFPTPWVISENDKMGAAGLPGRDAVPAVYAGEWDSSALYYYDNVRREIVLYNGHYYAVKTQGTTCTSADIPGGASSEKWEAFSGEFRSVATDVLLSHDVLASRGRFDGLVVDSLTATNSDFQDVVIRGVLSKMKTTITAAELGSTIAYKKYTALSHQGVLPWSSQANYLNVWRCGDVVDIDCGTTVCKLVLPTAWHATTNGSGTQISPSPTNYADGDFSFASGHGFLLTPNSTVRSYPSIDDIRGLVGRKMVFRNKSNTAEVYICAHRYKRLTSPNEQGDSTVVNYEDGLVVIGKLNIGEMLQVECCVDFVIGNPYSYEGYHWEFFGKGIKYL